MNNKSIIGVFTDESAVLESIHKSKALKLKINDVYGPFADHDILKAITRPSRLPHLAFFYGAGAALLTLAFTYWTSVIDYPLNIGGKPQFALPALVVVIYLITILGAATLSVFTFLARDKMYPGKPTSQPADRASDDRFYLVIGLPAATDTEMVEKLLKDNGAVEIMKS